MTAVIDRPADSPQHFTHIDPAMRPAIDASDMPLTPPVADEAWVQPVTHTDTEEAPIYTFDIPGAPEADQDEEVQTSPLRTKAANAIKGLLRRNRLTAEDQDEVADEEPSDEDYSHLPPPPPPPPAGGPVDRPDRPDPALHLKWSGPSLYPSHIKIEPAGSFTKLGRGRFEPVVDETSDNLNWIADKTKAKDGEAAKPHYRKIAKFDPSTGKVTRYRDDYLEGEDQAYDRRVVENVIANTELDRQIEHARVYKRHLSGDNKVDLDGSEPFEPPVDEEESTPQTPKMSRRAQEYADRNNPTSHQGDIEAIVRDIADDAELSFPEWVNAGSQVAPEFIEFVSDDDDLDVPGFVRPTDTEATADVESVDLPTDDRLSKAIAAAVQRAAQSVFEGRDTAEEESTTVDEGEDSKSTLERIKRDARVEKAVRVAGTAAVIAAGIGVAVLRSRQKRR